MFHFCICAILENALIDLTSSGKDIFFPIYCTSYSPQVFSSVLKFPTHPLQRAVTWTLLLLSYLCCHCYRLEWQTCPHSQMLKIYCMINHLITSNFFILHSATGLEVENRKSCIGFFEEKYLAILLYESRACTQVSSHSHKMQPRPLNQLHSSWLAANEVFVLRNSNSTAELIYNPQ